MKKINEDAPTNNISSSAIAKYDPLLAPAKKQPLRRIKPKLRKNDAVTEELVNELLIKTIRTKFTR